MSLFKKEPKKTEKSEATQQAVVHHTHIHSALRIQKPHVTEKTLRMSEENMYTFIVPQSLSKIEAKKQIEKLYDVQCIKTRATKGTTKTKQWRGKKGNTGEFKKITVTLKQGQKIELTGQK